jgi:DNA polymerase III subunit epsilon
VTAIGVRNFVADKEAATQWARQLLTREDWVILDTETTGLHNAEVVDIAIVNPKGEPIVDTLVCPTLSIPQEVSDIHGLFDADVADAPTFPEIYPLIPPSRVSCAMKAYAMWVGEWSDRRGSYKWQRLTGGNHRALGDCLATLQLIQKMAAIP